MITFPKEKAFKGKELEPQIFRTEVNEKKERSLVWIKDRPTIRDGESIEKAYARTIMEKEFEITGIKGFKCDLCGAIHRTKKPPKSCECESKPPKAEIMLRGGRMVSVKNAWCVCPSGHGFWNPLKYPDTGCKKCKQIETALTPKQKEAELKRNAELKKQRDEADAMLKEREKYKLKKEYEIKVQEWQVQAKLIAAEIQKLGEKNVQQK